MTKQSEEDRKITMQLCRMLTYAFTSALVTSRSSSPTVAKNAALDAVALIDESVVTAVLGESTQEITTTQK